MATISSRGRAPAAPGPEPIRGEPRRVETRRMLPAAALGAAVAVLLTYAAFAGGATDLSEAGKVQVYVAAVALGTVAGLVFGGLRLRASGFAYAGWAFLAGYALWAAL